MCAVRTQRHSARVGLRTAGGHIACQRDAAGGAQCERIIEADSVDGDRTAEAGSTHCDEAEAIGQGQNVRRGQVQRRCAFRAAEHNCQRTGQRPQGQRACAAHRAGAAVEGDLIRSDCQRVGARRQRAAEGDAASTEAAGSAQRDGAAVNLRAAGGDGERGAAGEGAGNADAGGAEGGAVAHSHVIVVGLRAGGGDGRAVDGRAAARVCGHAGRSHCRTECRHARAVERQRAQRRGAAHNARECDRAATGADRQRLRVVQRAHEGDCAVGGGEGRACAQGHGIVVGLRTRGGDGRAVDGRAAARVRGHARRTHGRAEGRHARAVQRQRAQCRRAAHNAREGDRAATGADRQRLAPKPQNPFILKTK